MNELNRREFVAAAAASALAAAQMGSTVLAEQQADSRGLPTRPLGKTGQRVSIIGLGGYHIGTIEESEAIRLMHEAIDNGLTFFDNCWEYNDGRSEELMGKALATGLWRDKVFLMSKVCGRDYTTAKRHLDDSLRRLQTDRIDLWQFHGIRWPDDPDLILADNGAVQAALEAKKAGKIQFIGFTGHQDPRHHLAMLAKSFDWDTVQMPLNILDAQFRSFQKLVLPVCTERRIGAVAMKALAGRFGRIPETLNVSAQLCRRYVLSLPISTLVCGISSRANLQQDLAIARDFRPMTEGEVLALLEQVKEPATQGTHEQYKTGDLGCNWYHDQTKQ